MADNFIEKILGLRKKEKEAEVKQQKTLQTIDKSTSKIRANTQVIKTQTYWIVRSLGAIKAHT